MNTILYLKPMLRFDPYFSNRYLVLVDNAFEMGWRYGYMLQQKNGSPPVDLNPVRPENQTLNLKKTKNKAKKIDYRQIWPDMNDYKQITPNIFEKLEDLDKRCFESTLEKYFYINILRSPVCKSYLIACAKVKPRTILEIGTGGDSAHSTGIFLFWLDGQGQLISVDRHYLSSAWPRYRENKNWIFIQGDSISTMKKLQSVGSNYFDLIFIDSSHTYPHTKMEIIQASYMTSAILLDDTTMKDIKRSIDEFLDENQDWIKIDCAETVSLLERHDKKT